MVGIPKRPPVRDDGFRNWIRERPCLLADRDPCECGKYVHVGSRRMVTEAAHVRSRGAGGGDPANIVGLCPSHHREQHRVGIKTFQSRHNIDLRAEANLLWLMYLETVAPWAECFPDDGTGGMP